MIEALIAGERNPAVLAELARGVLRRKIDALQMACDDRFTASHAQMCRPHRMPGIISLPSSPSWTS
jgi:transposase